jgi:hypothetical protein
MKLVILRAALVGEAEIRETCANVWIIEIEMSLHLIECVPSYSAQERVRLRARTGAAGLSGNAG